MSHVCGIYLFKCACTHWFAVHCSRSLSLFLLVSPLKCLSSFPLPRSSPFQTTETLNCWHPNLNLWCFTILGRLPSPSKSKQQPPTSTRFVPMPVRSSPTVSSLFKVIRISVAFFLLISQHIFYPRPCVCVRVGDNSVPASRPNGHQRSVERSLPYPGSRTDVERTRGVRLDTNVAAHRS